MIEAN